MHVRARTLGFTRGPQKGRGDMLSSALYVCCGVASGALLLHRASCPSSAQDEREAKGEQAGGEQFAGAQFGRGRAHRGQPGEPVQVRVGAVSITSRPPLLAKLTASLVYATTISPAAFGVT